MKKIKLYIASSLDGLISRIDGKMDWLLQDEDYGFADFMAGIDSTIMGYKTYQQILTYGDFPHKDKFNYVFTKRTMPEQEFVQFVSGNHTIFTENLKRLPGKDIWLIGGSELITHFYNLCLIDEIILSIHPIILRRGIPLFKYLDHEEKLSLKSCKSFNSGLVQLWYERKKN